MFNVKLKPLLIIDCSSLFSKIVDILLGPNQASEGLSLFFFTSGAMQVDLEKHLGEDRLSADIVTCLAHLQVVPFGCIV